MSVNNELREITINSFYPVSMDSDHFPNISAENSEYLNTLVEKINRDAESTIQNVNVYTRKSRGLKNEVSQLRWDYKTCVEKSREKKIQLVVTLKIMLIAAVIISFVFGGFFGFIALFALFYYNYQCGCNIENRSKLFSLFFGAIDYIQKLSHDQVAKATALNQRNEDLRSSVEDQCKYWSDTAKRLIDEVVKDLPKLLEKEKKPLQRKSILDRFQQLTTELQKALLLSDRYKASEKRENRCPLSEFREPPKETSFVQSAQQSFQAVLDQFSQKAEPLTVNAIPKTDASQESHIPFSVQDRLFPEEDIFDAPQESEKSISASPQPLQ